MTHFHLYIPSGLPSIKIPKIKLQKKLFSFSIGRTRDSYNVTSPRPDNTKFVPTISLQVHENINENIVENNPDHVIGDKQKNQINSNLPTSCIHIHNQNNLQNVLGATTAGGIILNIPFKANNARRAPRDMNHEKFTPCQRRFHQHENTITGNVKFSKGTGQGDQHGIFYEDICCKTNMVKIAPPPRKRKSKLWRHIQNDMIKIGSTTDVSQPTNQTLECDFNFTAPDGCDFSCINAVKRCHINPNNKSDPWMVNVDYRKLEKPPKKLIRNTNFSSVSLAFEDEFVNEEWNTGNADEKRTILKQRTESVNIFEMGNTINVFDDFDEIFVSNKTLSQPEQLKPKYDCDRIANKMISEPHTVDVWPNKRTIESDTKISTSDAYAKLKKERINTSTHNENVFLQNQGSENGFPTFEYSGNQNIAVNHTPNQDFAESRMRSSSCAKRTGKCEWEMFENCAIVGNENLFSNEFNLQHFRNNFERNVYLDEKCLTIALDLLDSEWRTGNINGK